MKKLILIIAIAFFSCKTEKKSNSLEPIVNEKELIEPETKQPNNSFNEDETNITIVQDYGNHPDTLKLCTAVQTNNFISDVEAEKALDRILSVIGASKRFVLQPCDNINNAVATSYKGIRYILYDRDFMDSLDSGDNWTNLFILAHEVGHHINGHSLDLVLYAADVIEPETLANKRQQELEADEFAGFILGKLGATLKQTSAGINLISSNKDDTYSTHPSKSKRLASVSSGYDKALVKEKVVYETPTNLQTSEEYFYSALSKENKENYSGALEDYTKSIELNPNTIFVYYNRGNVKAALKDYIGSIADYDKVIEFNSEDAGVFHNRGVSKEELKDYYGAIADYTKAIEIDPNNIKYYNSIIISKLLLKDFKGAKADCDKAIEIGSNNIDIYLSRGDANNGLTDYYAAIADYSQAIEIDFNNIEAYKKRGDVKNNLEDYNGAIADYTKAIEIDPNNKEGIMRGTMKRGGFMIIPDSYFARGSAKSTYLKDYYGAITDFTKLIELVPNGSAYIRRSISKYLLGDKNGACQDARKAQEYGSDVGPMINNSCN